MTQAIIHRVNWTAPKTTKLPGTLLDAASLSEATHYLQADGLYESYNCLGLNFSTAASCPATFMAPPVLATAAASVGGSLTASSAYKYKIVAKNARGVTIASNEVTGTTTSPNKTLHPTWAASTGATGYDVYRTAAGGAANSETYLASVGAVLTFTDDGTITPGTSTPPTTNTAVVDVTKSFGVSNWTDGISFAAQGGIECKAPGLDLSYAKSGAQAAFENGESVSAERALMLMVFGDGASAVDLTPAGGAVAPDVGAAILEGEASSYYTGVPTLHVPRTIGGLLMRNGFANRQGEQFFTAQGSKIASGGGYQVSNVGPNGVAPTAGELWLYATGEVAIARGPIIVVSQLSQTDNEYVVLVERPYVAAHDCFVTAVRVEIA